MNWYPRGSAAPILLALFLGAPLSQAATQATTPASPEPARTQKSVRGKLLTIDERLNALAMESDAGERLAWRFDKTVIKEAAKYFKAGAPVIVIYRQLASNEKRVTAIAFPGTASTPTYINVSGYRALLRSAPAVGDTCGGPDAGPASESVIPVGGRAEVLDACWCCAPADKTCAPSNKSGLGEALLVSCFE
jgi:hypothetical protein